MNMSFHIAYNSLLVGKPPKIIFGRLASSYFAHGMVFRQNLIVWFGKHINFWANVNPLMELCLQATEQHLFALSGMLFSVILTNIDWDTYVSSSDLIEIRKIDRLRV